MRLDALIFNLFKKAVNNYQAEEKGDGELSNKKDQITVRVEKEVKKFLEKISQETGVTLQEVVNLVLKSTMLDSRSLSNERNQSLLNIVERFFKVFEAHDINITNIYQFFKKERLKTTDLMETSNVINFLDDDILKKMGKIFNINWEWIKTGKGHFVGSEGRWYKSPERVLRSLVKEIIKGKNPELIVLFSGDLDKNNVTDEIDHYSNNINEDGERLDYEVNFVIKSNHSEPINFATYDLLESNHWDYRKSRQLAKAIIYCCVRGRIKVESYFCNNEQWKDLVYGDKIVAETIKGLSGLQSYRIENLVDDNPEFNKSKEFFEILEKYENNEPISESLINYRDYHDIFMGKKEIINKKEVLNGAYKFIFEKDSHTMIRLSQYDPHVLNDIDKDKYRMGQDMKWVKLNEGEGSINKITLNQ